MRRRLHRLPAVVFDRVTQALPGRRWRSRTSASRSPRAPVTRCAARTAPARARSARSSAGIHRPDAGQVIVDGRPSRLRRPAAGARAPASASSTRSWRSATTCRSPRTCASGRCPRRRDVRVARARWRGARARCSAAIGAEIDVRRRIARADDRTAAAGADRRGGRRRRADHRVRRADQQPVAARGRAALRPDRPAAGARASPCIYVSHRMDEIFRLCDAVTVLRDGRHVDDQADRVGRSRDAGRADDRPPARRVLPRRTSRPRPGRSCCASKG